jgi:hypothetical protein
LLVEQAWWPAENYSCVFYIHAIHGVWTDCEGMDAVANAKGGPKGERQDGVNHRTALHAVRFPYGAGYSDNMENFGVNEQAMVAGQKTAPAFSAFTPSLAFGRTAEAWMP